MPQQLAKEVLIFVHLYYNTADRGMQEGNEKRRSRQTPPPPPSPEGRGLSSQGAAPPAPALSTPGGLQRFRVQDKVPQKRRPTVQGRGAKPQCPKGGAGGRQSPRERKKSPLPPKNSNAPLWRKPLGGIADNRKRTIPHRYLACAALIALWINFSMTTCARSLRMPTLTSSASLAMMDFSSSSCASLSFWFLTCCEYCCKDQ